MAEERPKEEQTVQYRGKACSKQDIEDLLTKLEKRRPMDPDPDDCCGQGCDPCIFDTFDRQMSIYEDKKEEIESLLLEFEQDY